MLMGNHTNKQTNKIYIYIYSLKYTAKEVDRYSNLVLKTSADKNN